MTKACCGCGKDLAEIDWSGRPDSATLEPAINLNGDAYCKACISSAREKISPEVIDAARKIEEEKIQSVIVITTPSLDGYRVAKVVDVISAECVFGMNIFKDFFAGLTDFFGGRSGASQGVLRDARETCIRELKREAHRVGANAVIGVDLDYSEFSGQGKSMLFLVASGTAVVLDKTE